VARLHALNDRLALYEKIDWKAFRAKDPADAKEFWLQFAQTREARDALLKHLQQRSRDDGTRGKWYGIRDARTQEQIYAQAVQLPAKPYPSLEGLKSMMEVYDYREMRIHKPEDFYDASFVAALDKSGYIDGLYKSAGQR
jgi:hypothetical protein